jgi:hypothetical protein
MPIESGFEDLLLGLLVDIGTYRDYAANGPTLVSYNLCQFTSQSRRSSMDRTSAS